MQTVILCGGQGTRIRDVAADLPKPMISIGRYPILWHIMKGYAAWEHKDFILCLGYQGSAIRDFFLNYQVRTSDVMVRIGKNAGYECLTSHEATDWNVTLAETGLNAMTGARVYRIRQYITDDYFLLTYGDGVGDINISELIAFHRNHGKVMTLTGVRPPGRFGELELDGNLVTGFNEKPQATAGIISGGFFVCSRRLFDFIDDREELMLEMEPMQRLVAEGQLMVFRHHGFWHPMDTYRDYKLLNEMWETGKAPWRTW